MGQREAMAKIGMGVGDDRMAIKWHKPANGEILKDGWYWRKPSPDCKKKDVIEVCNEIYLDKEPIDSFGAEWRVHEYTDFHNWYWYGPLEVPE